MQNLYGAKSAKTSRIAKSEELRVKTPFNRNFYSTVREKKGARDHRLSCLNRSSSCLFWPTINCRSFVRSRHLTTLSPEASKALPRSLKRVKLRRRSCPHTWRPHNDYLILPPIFFIYLFCILTLALLNLHSYLKCHRRHVLKVF